MGNNQNANIFKEYNLIKENIVYKFLIKKNDKEITINYDNYYISFNHNYLSLLTKKTFKSLNKAYEFIFNVFEKNKMIIKNIIKNKEIILLIKKPIKKRKKSN